MIKIGNVRLIGGFLAFVLLFFVGRRLVVSVSDVAGRCASCLVYPFLVAQERVVSPVKSFFQNRRSIQELNEQLNNLRNQNEALMADLIALKGQTQYFNEIQELLAFKKRYESEHAHLGQILFKQFTDQSHYFLVNRGSSHGIEPDMIALYNNCLVGRVAQVYPWYCKVIAITDNSCKIASYCDISGSYGIHEGSCKLGQTMLKRISHLSTVHEGELVLSSGEGMVFPRGFALGKIKNFTKKGLWYCIDVEPLINLEELSYCLLIHKGKIN